jgi:hypothetical protein
VALCRPPKGFTAALERFGVLKAMFKHQTTQVHFGTNKMLHISVCSSFSDAIRVTNTGKPEGKKPIGRRTRWMDNIERDLFGS